MFRGSENDFLASEFHRKCDNVENTFTLIKTEFNKIIGGFTPIKWESPEPGRNVEDPSEKTFLLSFDLR